jgi:hypothetical protein
LEAKQILASAVAQDDGCRGDPHEDHHRHDSRRPLAHQTELAVAAVVVFTTAAFVAATLAAFGAAEAALAAAFIAAALATFRAATKAAAETTLAALTATLAAFVAATLAAFIAAAALTAVAADEVTASVFEDEAARTAREGDRLAVATLQFIPGWACGGWRGHARVAADFIAAWAMRRWNRIAVATLRHIASGAFGAVLVEAGTAASIFAVAAAGKRHRATRAEHEKADGEKCRETWLHRESLASLRGGLVGPAHRPQLHSIECKRVECGTPVAEHVSDVPQIIGEAFVFM